MKSAPLVRAAFAAAVALPLALAGSSAAVACDNGVRIVTDVQAPKIARAEKALNEGKHTLAAVGVLQVFPDVRNAQASSGTPLMNRALRIVALAAIRTSGELSAGGAFRGSTAEEKSANIEWAVNTLRALNKARPNTPSLQTDLGEALATVDKHKGEALKILAALDEKDLITSAQGYAALARLREAAGDKAGGEAARKRCEATAKTPGVCRASAGPSA